MLGDLQAWGNGYVWMCKKGQGERERKEMQKQNSAQKAPLGKCGNRTLQMSSNFVGIDPSNEWEKKSILYWCFLWSALEEGQGWNTKTSGYSNERVLINTTNMTNQNKPFP